MLEEDRAGRNGSYWFGDRIGHADIAVACAIRHTTEALPDVIAMQDYPSLFAHCERLEAMPVFREISQPFIPPT